MGTQRGFSDLSAPLGRPKWPFWRPQPGPRAVARWRHRGGPCWRDCWDGDVVDELWARGWSSAWAVTSSTTATRERSPGLVADGILGRHSSMRVCAVATQIWPDGTAADSSMRVLYCWCPARDSNPPSVCLEGSVPARLLLAALEEAPPGGLSADELAARVSRSRPWVYQRLVPQAAPDAW